MLHDTVLYNVTEYYTVRHDIIPHNINHAYNIQNINAQAVLASTNSRYTMEKLNNQVEQQECKCNVKTRNLVMTIIRIIILQ